MSPIVPVVGPEVLAGSTRMKAGTAQKLVLNMLSTAALIRLGYVTGNRMTNMRARNSKLLARSLRILMAETGLDEPAAAVALEAAAVTCPQRSSCQDEPLATGRGGRPGHLARRDRGGNRNPARALSQGRGAIRRMTRRYDVRLGVPESSTERMTCAMPAMRGVTVAAAVSALARSTRGGSAGGPPTGADGMPADGGDVAGRTLRVTAVRRECPRRLPGRSTTR